MNNNCYRSNLYKKLLLIIPFIALSAGSAFSQFSVGTDIYNRYVWRGTDFGNSPSIQPSLTYSSGGFEAGFWGAFTTTGSPGGEELDFYGSYGIDTGSGTLGLTLTDYFFPGSSQGQYFKWEDNHVLEPTISFTGPDDTPLYISASINAAGADKDNSVYLETGYSFSNTSIFLGMVPSSTSYYGTQKAGVINTGISTSKDIKITDSFSLPLSGSFILNPYNEDVYLLVGVSL